MNKPTKHLRQSFTALAVAGAFSFQKIAWADTMPSAGWLMVANGLSISVEGGGEDDVPGRVKHQLSPKLQRQQLTFPLVFTLFFWLDEDAGDHKDPKQAGKGDPHPLGKSFKEITSQTHSKDSFVKIEQELRNSFPTMFSYQLLPHIISLLYYILGKEASLLPIPSGESGHFMCYE